MKRQWISVTVILVLWQVASLCIHREVILPYPLTVMKYMCELPFTPFFYQAILASLKRIVIGIVVASSGIFLGIVAGKHQKVDDYLSVVISMLQTIPQIAFLLIFLLWFNRETSIILIVLLMTYPTFYNNAKEGIKAMDPMLIQVSKIYPTSWWHQLTKVDLPLIKDAIISAFESCIPTTLKIAVMAEVIVSAQTGIGRALNIAKINIDSVAIFAWVIWMIILMKLFLALFHTIIERMK